MPQSPLDISEQEIRKRCGPLLEGAIDEAARLRHNYIGTEHLFNALTSIPGSPASRMLLESGLEPRDFRNHVRRVIGAGDDAVSEWPPLTPRTHRVLAMAVYLADDSGDRFVTEEQLLLALLQEGEGIPVRELVQRGFDVVQWIDRLLDEIEGDDSDDFDEFMFTDLESSLGEAAENSENAPRRMPTPLLDKYGRDLTEQAKHGKIGPAIGREIEIRMVARTLKRNKKNNPLLLGDSGVGKTAVVEGLAYNIAHGLAPKFLLGRRIVGLEIGMLVAGTSLRGQFEERIVGIVDEVKNAPEVILFIDEIHTIVGAGDTIDSNLDAANILKPALARGEITCIGATTFEEYRKAIAKDPALDRRFRTVDIQEQNVTESLVVVEHVYKRYEDHHKVKILPEARQAAVRLSDRYMRDRRLPDKALDLLDEACARMVIQTNSPDSDDSGEFTLEVSSQTITEVLSEWTGIPVSELTANERQRFAQMGDTLRERVIGQDHAIQVVSDAIKTNRAGLGDPKRPVGVFLFLGPSGVGKTELAKTLAQFLFNDEDAMIRLDMSEFHDEHTVARLIGAPPGYKGMEQGGQLTEALRRKPYSVVLLDEVEKAAPEVFDIFLQVFDEGRLTDSQGATIDGRHAVWIMTSNIGTGDVGKGLGFTATPDQLPDYDFHLKKHFRPEFLNRLDEVVVFRPLTPEALDGILDLQLTEMTGRLTEQKLTLDLDESARELLLREGYDPAYGARPLRRAIERLLTRPLSNAILDETFHPGDAIQVSADGDELVLQSGEAGPVAAESAEGAPQGSDAADAEHPAAASAE